MNMKRTANKFQRAYMVAKARVQEVESQQEAIEKKFIADKGIGQSRRLRSRIPLLHGG